MNQYRWIGVALLVFAAVLLQSLPKPQIALTSNYNSLDKILASSEIELPIALGNLGQQMVEVGVFADESMLGEFARPQTSKIKLTRQNAPVFLNFLWGLGLGNRNPILEQGPMQNPRFKLENLASIGGFTISATSAIDHYSKHEFIKLDPGQQAMLEYIAKKIYRPCCDNSTYFPDCNHGMAMLALLELAVSQNLEISEIYNLALAVNAYWFEGSYRMIAEYLDKQNLIGNQTAEEILSQKYSSASGYKKILQSLKPRNQKTNPSCGVN